MLFIFGLVSSLLAFPWDRRIDTVYLRKPEGYIAHTELVIAKVGQVQDFVCPGNQEFELYLVTRRAYQFCDVAGQQLLHYCLNYKFSKVSGADQDDKRF